MPQKTVCQMALCVCDKGVAPTPLQVSSQAIVTIGGMAVATVMDNQPGANITPFGVCKELSQAAGGVPVPCAPVLAAPWSPGSSVDTILGLKVLTADSKLACQIGGTITIKDPGCLVDVKTD